MVPKSSPDRRQSWHLQRNVFLVLPAVLAALLLSTDERGRAQQPPPVANDSVLTINAVAAAELRSWDAYVTQETRAGRLRLRSVRRDPALPAREVERYQQFHEGVPIWGADVVRDAERGVAASIFGILAPDLAISVTPAFDATSAAGRLATAAGPEAVLLQGPDVVIAPTDDWGRYRLAYTAVMAHQNGVDRLFLDAQTGGELFRYSELQAQQYVGTGTGVLGDRKKISVYRQSSTYVAYDRHRPPVIETFDLRGNLARLKLLQNGILGYQFSDRASDADNVWTDVAVVDAHVHVSWTYDFYYKRFGRNGLDGRDGPISIAVNGVTQEGALTLPSSDFGLYAVNAFWCESCGPGRGGLMYFGNGIPSGFFLTGSGQHWTYTGGALDVAAHELTHGVTSSTSDLVYRNESGALNEAFSDMMAKGAEFYFHQAGGDRGQADYVVGKDVVRAARAGSRNGIRSLAEPTLYGHPDHYSRFIRTTADSGGVHSNSGIPNHAFYLAIEGGTNRTSGRSVQGVGASNRDQIEKVFYRAFTLLLPSSARFITARDATIQAARDLYGSGGAVERAVTQAWEAVGVFPQAELSYSFSPSPVRAQSSGCFGLTPPCWLFRTTVQEMGGVGFTVTAATFGFFDNNQNLLNTLAFSFAEFFDSCGSGSARIPARGTACSDLVVSLGGRANGYVAFLIEGRDDNGASLQFFSDLLRLASTSGTAAPESDFAPPRVLPLNGGGGQ